MIKLAPKLYGVVLAGGRSQRMGEDKSLIPYQDAPHAIYCFSLLAKHCEQVYLSLREDSNEHLKQLPHLIDSVHNAGPIAGILTAMDRHPNGAWLVLASDFPFIDDETLKNLVSLRDPSQDATAFITGDLEKPEPLCCIYEPSMRSVLQKVSAIGNASPQKALMESRVRVVKTPHSHLLFNANEPQERDQALKR